MFPQENSILFAVILTVILLLSNNHLTATNTVLFSMDTCQEEGKKIVDGYAFNPGDVVKAWYKCDTFELTVEEI